MNIEFILLGVAVLDTAALGYLLWSQNDVGQKLKNQMVVDTSGLIDGRLVEIVSSGFVPQRLIIPQFVVAELQFLADQGDAYKRERARYGLDVVRRLQDMRQTEVVIKPGMARGIKEVDDKLVALAKKQGAMLYTTDFNLNQVAQIEGVRVLNVNELAQGLRAMHLPGERADIKITQIGQDRTQGVGYLEDGTMVVVEQAAKKLNQHVQVEFTRMLQTQAGKMMFATLHGSHKHQQSTANGSGSTGKHPKSRPQQAPQQTFVETAQQQKFIPNQQQPKGVPTQQAEPLDANTQAQQVLAAESRPVKRQQRRRQALHQPPQHHGQQDRPQQ